MPKKISQKKVISRTKLNILGVMGVLGLILLVLGVYSIFEVSLLVGVILLVTGFLIYVIFVIIQKRIKFL